MKKHELVAEVAKKTGTNQDVVNKILDSFSEVVVETCVKNGGEVNLPMGKFRRKVNAARNARNPLTGETITVKESHTLKFTPSGSVKVVL